MHRKINILLLIGTVFLFSCNNEKRKDAKKNLSKPILAAKRPPLSDTSITISIKTSLNNIHAKLTEQNGKETLYKYFKKQGLLTEASLPDSLTDKDYANECVYFDTLFLINPKNISSPIGIIQFWITPPGGSSHCYQPHEAIVTNTAKGFSIVHEDFISDFSVITKASSADKQVTLSGYYFDCPDTAATRNFNVTINVLP